DVAPHVEMVGAISLRRRRDEVADGAWTVRTRIQRRDRPATRVRTRQRHRLQRRRGGNRGDARDALVGPRALVVDKEKLPVSHDGPAYREAELIAPGLG